MFFPFAKRALVLGAAVYLPLAGFAADPGPASAAANAATAWRHLAAQSTTPAPPAKSTSKEPNREELHTWADVESKRLLGVAAEAREFAGNYPNDSNVPGARKIEEEALFAAVRLGDRAAEQQLAELDKLRLQDGELPADDRLAIRMRQVQSEAQVKLADSPEAAMKAYLEGARSLMKEFPGRPEPYSMLLEVADGEDEAQAKAVVEELLRSEAPEPIKETVRGIQHRLEALGKPLGWKFTALDGREVDLASMTGRIVLIDFWATWCAPCVKRMPKLKEAYTQLQELGLDVVGIDLDPDKAALEKFVKTQGLAWPQYFDGKGWNSRFVREYGVSSLPCMWLVDRQGRLRDLHADTNLVEKVQTLLKEKE